MNNTITQNKNLLSPTNFKLSIASNRFANVEYFCVNCNLPACSMTEVNLPFKQFANSVSGERINYEPLNIRFIVDENTKNYSEILLWLVSNSTEDTIVTSDATLSILNSSNLPNRSIKFHDIFPTSLGGIDFSTQTLDVEHVTIDASFRYSHFELLPTS